MRRLDGFHNEGDVVKMTIDAATQQCIKIVETSYYVSKIGAVNSRRYYESFI